MIMHKKVDFIMILEKHDICNYELSYILKLDNAVVPSRVLESVGKHNRISIALKNNTFV